MDLSIVIVSFNVKYFLEQCLFSVLEATGDIHSEILVVDNFSKDGSIDYLKQKFPSVKFLELQENRGFAKANNSVLNQLKGKFVLLLNPDTLVTPDSLRQCIEHLQNNPSTGAVGVRMINGEGRFLRESLRGKMSLWNSFTKLSGLAQCFPTSRIFSGYYMGWLQANEKHKISVLSGAFIMIRSNLYQTIGGFDERFFMYGEDIELSYAVLERGFQNYYLGNTTILHFKGESTIKDQIYLQHFFGAMILFNEKRASWLVKSISKPIIKLTCKLVGLKKEIAPIKKSLATVPEINKSSLKEGRSTTTIGNETTHLHVVGKQYTYNKIFKYIEEHSHETHYIHHLSSKSIVGSGQSLAIN